MDVNIPDCHKVTLGIIAALATVFAWSGGTFSFLKAARIIPPALLNRTRILIALGITAAAACIIHGILPHLLIALPSGQQWFWLGLSGIIGFTIGDYLGFSALRILGARRQSVVGTISPAFAGLGGFLLLDEHISLIGMGGMALSIVGVMWAMGGTEDRHEVHKDGYGSFTTGTIMAIGGAACQGIGLVFAKVGMAGGTHLALATHQAYAIPPLHANFMRLSIAFLSAYVMDFARRDHHRPFSEAFADKEGRRAMYLGTLFGPVLGVALSLYAVSKLDAGTAQTIFSLVPFVILAIAAIRQHEKLRLTAIVGAVIAVGGVVLLIYS